MASGLGFSARPEDTRVKEEGRDFSYEYRCELGVPRVKQEIALERNHD